MATPIISEVWPVAAALSVFLVLAGHVTLESGLVRAKHSVNAAAKALVEVGLVTLIVWAIGHGLMGPGGPLAGSGPFLPGEATPALLFDIAVALAAGTVLSGPLAERTTLRAYALAVAVFALAILPFTLHWAWAAQPEAGGWLASLGFIDLAGGATLHVAGASAALAAALMVGPRNGRFGGPRRVPVVQSQSFPFAALGVLLLWLGWFALALGRASALGLAPAPIVLNLILGGAAAITSAFVANQIRPDKVSIITLVHATLAGIIACSAGAHLFAPLGAVAVGMLGAFAAIAGAALVEAAEIDDALGIASAHLFAGALGVLAVAFTDLSTLVPVLLLQAAGLLAMIAWPAAVMAATLAAARLVMRLKVDAEEERIGLNIAEHAMVTDVAMLVSQMSASSRRSGGFAYLDADADGELGQVAREYNRAIDIFQAQIKGVREKLTLAEAAVDQAGALNAQFAAELAERDEKLEQVTREIAFLTDQLARALVAVDNLKGMRAGFVRLIGRTFRQPIERLHLMAKRAASSRNQGDIDALIEAAREESATLARRLADVIDYAQASTFETPPLADRAPMEKLIGEINLLYRPRAESKGVKLRVVWTPDVSAMSASATALRKIMGELVNHAIESTPQAGLVNFSAKRGPDGGLIIDVVDSGSGVSPGQLAQALDPLASGEVPPGEDDASLGLALVKKLVDMHGGALTIRSKPGIGTQVRATIPAEHLTQPKAA
jgi:Amt family ammonium transporter